MCRHLPMLHSRTLWSCVGVCIKDSASRHIIWIRKYRWKVIQLSLARFCAWSLYRLFLTTALNWECGILFEEKILRAFCKQQILLSLLQCLSSKKGLGKPSGKLLYSDFCLWDAQQVNCAKAPSSGPVQWWEKADSLATHSCGTYGCAHVFVNKCNVVMITNC